MIKDRLEERIKEHLPETVTDFLLRNMSEDKMIKYSLKDENDNIHLDYSRLDKLLGLDESGTIDMLYGLYNESPQDLKLEIEKYISSLDTLPEFMETDWTSKMYKNVAAQTGAAAVIAGSIIAGNIAIAMAAYIALGYGLFKLLGYADYGIRDFKLSEFYSEIEKKYSSEQTI